MPFAGVCWTYGTFIHSACRFYIRLNLFSYFGLFWFCSFNSIFFKICNYPFIIFNLVSLNALQKLKKFTLALTPPREQPHPQHPAPIPLILQFLLVDFFALYLLFE